MKLACMRPLAVQKAARRASDSAQQRKVLRQLALQEAGGVIALHADDAEVGQGGYTVQNGWLIA